jgi:hypothetical protein
MKIPINGSINMEMESYLFASWRNYCWSLINNWTTFQNNTLTLVHKDDNWNIVGPCYWCQCFLECRNHSFGSSIARFIVIQLWLPKLKNLIINHVDDITPLHHNIFYLIFWHMKNFITYTIIISSNLNKQRLLNPHKHYSFYKDHWPFDANTQYNKSSNLNKQRFLKPQQKHYGLYKDHRPYMAIST